MSHFLDYIVSCGGERIAIRVDYKDARIDAYTASLNARFLGKPIIIERAGRVVERWQNGERMQP